MTAISRNSYIDKSDLIVNNCNNTYHSTIKMKPAIKSNTYIDSSKQIYDKNPKSKIGDIGRISKHKNIFARGYTTNVYEKSFLSKKGKNTVPWRYAISALKGELIVGTLSKKNCKRQIKKRFRVEKRIKRKGIKLNVNRKGYGSSFSSCIDKKDIVQMTEYFQSQRFQEKE